MRGLPYILLIAGCANAQVAPDAGIDSGPPADAEVPDAEVPDAGTEAGVFLDDTAADFDGTLSGAVVESWGAIAPRAYYTGGLRVRGSDTGVFTDAVTATWTGVEAMAFTTKIAAARDLDMQWGTGIPAGVGLTSGDDLTLAYDGEIWLEAGTWTFYVLADDHAFLELSPVGMSTFGRVVSANWSAEGSGTWNATVSGWYPIRLAHCEQTVGNQLRVELQGPGQPLRGALSRHRLRFPASGLTGLTIAGFDDGRLTGDHASSIDTVAPAGVYFNTGQPGDLAITGGDDFSVRWTGQLRIDEAGDYAFRYLTEDGQRLWIDGAPVADLWDDSSHTTTTDPLPLDEGWHDLVVDLHEATGTAQAFLGVETGPDLIAAQLPVDHLRPVETRRERYDTGVDHTDRAIPDLGQAESSIVIDAPPGAKTHGVDLAWTFDHGCRNDLEIELVAPDGSSTMVRDHDETCISGSVTQRLHTEALDEATANGLWKLRVRDTISLDTGTLRDFTLTVHHRAGQPPIVEDASYESSVMDLGATVTAYQSFSWHAAVAAGTSVKLYARSGDTAQETTSAAWSSPMVDPDGGPPPVPARRYFQYRIELESDGDGSALVDWVRLDTREEIQ